MGVQAQGEAKPSKAETGEGQKKTRMRNKRKEKLPTYRDI